MAKPLQKAPMAKPLQKAPTVDFYSLRGDPPDIRVGENVTAVVCGKVASMSINNDDEGKRYSIIIEYHDIHFLKGKASNKELEAMDMEEYAKMRMRG